MYYDTVCIMYIEASVSLAQSLSLLPAGFWKKTTKKTHTTWTTIHLTILYLKPTEIFELSSCQKRTRTVQSQKPWPWFPGKKTKKQHVRSPQLTPKHKKIVFTCLLRNINALGVLDSFLCSVEARFLGKPSKIPHNFKKSTLWKQIALTKTGQKAAWVCTMNTFASIISWLGKKIEEPNWIAGT